MPEKMSLCLQVGTSSRKKTENAITLENLQYRLNDDLYTNLLDKNGISFWENWNSITKVGNSVSSRINGNTEKKGIAEAFATYFESVYDNHDTSQ